MSDATQSPRSPICRITAVAVGLFATWQLVFLPAANLINFVPCRPNGPPLEPLGAPYQSPEAFTSVEPIQRTAECADAVLDFWTEASGQEQGWSLFAPGPPDYSVFLAVEFQFADGTSDTALSPFEPADKRNPPFRMPLVDNRWFNYEAQFIYPVWYASPKIVAQFPDSFRNLPDIARSWRGPIRSWLAWRLRQYRAAHPGCGEPTAVTLKHRYITIPRPGQPAEWTDPPEERPFARWHPADDSFEPYDAVNGRFVPPEAKP